MDESSRTNLIRRLWPAAGLVGVFCLLAVVAAPGVDGPFILDSLKLEGRIEGLLQERGDDILWQLPSWNERPGGRVVSYATFIANAQASGGILDATSVKITNVIIHGLATVLVFWLARLVARLTPYYRYAAAIALAVAALWALSPANLSTALYAVQRMTQLATVFVLIGLICFLAWRQRPGGLSRTLFLGSGYLIALVLACASKENGVLLIPLTAVLEVAFFRFKGVPGKPRYYITGMSLAFFFLAASVVALRPDLLDYSDRPFSLWERVISQPRVLFLYLQELLLPLRPDIGLFYNNLGWSKGLLTPPHTLLYVLALSAAIGLTGYLMGTRYAYFAAGPAFYFVGHSLESTIFPLELIFLHRNYLPSFGIYLMVCLVGVDLLSRIQRTRVAIPLLTAYVALFAASAYAQSLTWQSERRIHAAAVSAHPDSYRARVNYAFDLNAQGRVGEALAITEAGIERAPLGEALFRLASLYIRCTRGLPIPEHTYEQIATARSGVRGAELATALRDLLSTYRSGQCSNLDLRRFTKALDRLRSEGDNLRNGARAVKYYASEFRDEIQTDR